MSIIFLPVLALYLTLNVVPMTRRVSTLSSRDPAAGQVGDSHSETGGHLPNLVNPLRELVHNSPRLVNEHNILLPRIINICIVSESVFKIYIRGY